MPAAPEAGSRRGVVPLNLCSVVVVCAYAGCALIGYGQGWWACSETVIYGDSYVHILNTVTHHTQRHSTHHAA